MEQIKGLLATPDIRPAGGLRAVSPQMDTTVRKNVDDTLANVTKLAALQSRRARQAEEDMLNARATSLVNEYIIYGKDVFFGKNGAMYQKGTEVVKGIDGESWVSYNQGKLREKRDLILSSVEGDKRLYEKVKEGLERQDVSFYSAINAHYGQESHNYVVEQNTYGLENELSAITAGGVTPERVGRVRGYSANIARLNGRNVSDPVYARTHSNEVRAAVSNAAKAGITLVLDKGDTAAADRQYIAAVREGMLDANDQLAVQKQINTVKEEQHVSGSAGNVALLISQSRTPSFVAARSVAPASGSFDASLLAFAGIDAEQATVDGYGKNMVVTEMANAQVMGALVREYGTIEAAIAAATVGREVMDAAVAGAEKKGNIAAWQNELSPGDKGKVTAAINRYRNDATRRTTPDEAEFRAWAVAQNPDDTPETINKIVEAAKANFVASEVMQDTRRTVAAKNIVSALANGEEPKVSDMSALTQEQVVAVSLLKARQRASNPPSDIEFYNGISNPQTLKAMSDADFMLLGQAKLGPAEYKEAAERRNILKGVKNVDKLYVSRDTVKPMVESFMAEKNPDYNADEDGKYVFNRAVDLVRRKVQEVVNARGSEPTKAEIEEIVGQTLRGDRLFVPPGFVKSGEYKSVYALTISDLSDAAKDLGKEMAKAMFGDSFPDDAATLSAVKEFLLFSSNALPENVIKKAKAEYGEQIDEVRERYRKGGVILDDTAAIRMTLYALQKDPKYFEPKPDAKYNSATGVRKSVLYGEEFKGTD